jgi:hypothetical protein
MSYPATVFKIMIASPSDVKEEREIARNLIFEWNSINSEAKQMVLLPIGWEHDSYPLMGKHPQKILNEQLLDNCDLLVAIFWTKIGTATEEYLSGSIEEIEKHIESGKPVMIYFSNAMVEPNKFDMDQYKKLIEFQDSCKSRSLFQPCDNVEHFKKKFSGHLQMIINNEMYFKEEIKLTDIDELGLSDFFGTNEVKEEAVTLLKEAAEYGKGTFTKHDDLSGWLTIQVKDKVIIETKENRVVATWKRAIEQLVALDMVEDVKYNGYRYNILDAGYEYLENNNLLVD